MTPEAGQVWMTAGWRQVPTYCKIERVESDEIWILFEDGRRSIVSLTAFLRTWSFYPDLPFREPEVA